MVASTTMTPAPAQPGNKEGPQLVVPFTRASYRHQEPFNATSTLSQSASAVQVGPINVAAYGFIDFIELQVTVSGGAGTAGTVTADSPWNWLSNVQLTDVNGAPIVGPLTGYELYLANKYGGYWNAHAFDPKSYLDYSAMTTLGACSFMLRIPVGINGRSGLGCLANQNSSSSYRLSYTVNAATSVVTGATFTTAPTVTVRPYLHAWAQPTSADTQGRPNEVEPPNHGTVSFWSKTIQDVTAGANVIRLTRTGNYIRNLIMIYRDTTQARVQAQLPTDLSLWNDTRLVFDMSREVIRGQMHRQFGFVSPTAEAINGWDNAVLVVAYTDDFDGSAGAELGDRWTATLQSTRMELRGTFGAAGTLTVLTNDVSPAGDSHSY
jgi:hypothetical protein